MSKLNTLKVGDSFSGLLFVQETDIRKKKNGQNYLSVKLSDNTGSINGNIWSYNEEVAETFTPGQVVELNGTISEYAGTKQFNFNEYNKLNEQPDDLSEWIVSAPKNTTELKEDLDYFLNVIQGSAYEKAVHFILNLVSENYFSSPAAKSNHHAFFGGLAYHSLTMSKLALAFSKVYPQLDVQLMVAAALIHDAGKTVELSGSIGTTYTLQGELIGHISILDGWLQQYAIENHIDENDESFLILRHTLLSHHGKREWGSPVEPYILEAQILHDIDMSDASIEAVTEAFQSTDKGQFSEKIFPVDNKKFYKFHE